MLLLVWPSASAASGPEKMWTWVTRGVGQLVDGQLGQAVTSFGKAREGAADPALDALVGLAALAGNRPATALRQLEGAIRRGASRPLVFYWAGRAALAAGRRRLALKRMEQALNLGGDQPVLRMGHAIVARALGRGKQARDSLLEVAAREPNLLDPALYPTPAQGAVELLAKLLRRFPVPLQVERTRAHLLARAGRVLAALAAFRALLQKIPGDADALQMSARCLALLGRKKQALALADQALTRAPGMAQARLTRGEILLLLGQTERAVDDLRRAADGLPREAPVLARLAQACAEAEQLACARKYFRYAVGRDPNLAAAHLGLALIQQQGKGIPAEGVWARFVRAIELNPGSSRAYRAAAHFAGLQGWKKRVARMSAAARNAARVERRLARKVKRARQQSQRQGQNLDLLRPDGTCDAACGRVLARQKSTWVRFLRAHLALRQGRRQAGISLLRPLAGRLKTSLLSSDPATVKQRGRSTLGPTYVLVQTLPMVPGAAFR
jgi:aspartate beta-hydroxylase